MNGIEATRQLRAGGYQGIILGVTGDTSNQQVASFMANGADQVIEKPLKLETFINCVNRYRKYTHGFVYALQSS